ncbi:hypothetical protein L3X38_014751 [Prunus dulcis]|uniref:Trehalose 6-phosphate phosphatase n=1 Tax=Prunus dulcis TaxID=3755 RepID=A0AAD4WQW5_PRUDU|nr:hypothetical protein L3X38_014751 [Prunus dulcis]
MRLDECGLTDPPPPTTTNLAPESDDTFHTPPALKWRAPLYNVATSAPTRSQVSSHALPRNSRLTNRSYYFIKPRHQNPLSAPLKPNSTRALHNLVCYTSGAATASRVFWGFAGLDCGARFSWVSASAPAFRRLPSISDRNSSNWRKLRRELNLDPMDLKSNHAAPVLTDPTPLSKSRLGVPSSLLQYSPPGAAFSAGLILTIPRRKAGLLDDVRSNSWLDAMKSSSPPHRKITKDVNNEPVANEADIAYHTWMVKYPSALTYFEQITNYAKGKRIALFLDYDGTLSPIVDNPDCAFMSDAMRAAVRRVAKHFPTAIISGRSHDKVYEFVGLKELYYAGSHGMDIMGPGRQSTADDHRNGFRTTDKQGKDVNLFQPAAEFLPMIGEVYESLVGSTKDIEGAKVENNKFCVSVHYRNVDEKSWPAVAQCVHDILKDYPRLRLTHGRKVLEVRPMINWDKGKAVTFLLESLGLSDCEDVLPIYIGDDRTDEDAFKVLREGNRGYGILVSAVPKESNAFYSLREPSEVMEFLKSLVMWRKSSAL